VTEFVTGDAVAEIAAGLEDAGFDACQVTDHPFADDRWLAGGGHHALEPTVALSFAAAATRRLRLHTHVYVLPYRNPFLAAKAVLSLDVLSGGRVTLGVAAGYLKSEFWALGVDFDERNELLEEGIAAMKAAWTSDGVALQGRHFSARGNTMLPRPASQPHPPVWMGGNSERAIRRAVEQCEGWAPFPTTPDLRAVRTASLTTMADLTARVEVARRHATDVGRTEPLDICFASLLRTGGGRGDSGRIRGEVHAMEEAGVTWLSVGVGGDDRSTYLANARRYADEVIALLR
jgi:probable F420-dependent oxidoreductase